MEGVEMAKNMVLQNLDNRIIQIEHNGCPEGKVRREKVSNLTDKIDRHDTTIEKIFDRIDRINDKIMWGLLIMIIIGFLAGVNIMQNMNLIPK